jgi:hypothetical protein
MCWLSYGPIVKREIPGSEFFITDPVLVLFAGYLETRLASLELAFHPLQTLLPRPRSRPVPTTALGIYVPISTVIVASSLLPRLGRALVTSSSAIDPEIKREPQGGLEDKKIDNLVLGIGLASFAGSSDPKCLCPAPVLSFAGVVFAAVKSTAAGSFTGENGSSVAGVGSSVTCRPSLSSKNRPQQAHQCVPVLGIGWPKEEMYAAQPDSNEHTQMDGLFFGLHTKSTNTPAAFPTRTLAERLMTL